MKIVAILLVVCFVAISNVSAKKPPPCFNKGKLIAAAMGLKGKGNPSPADCKKCILDQVQIPEKKPAVEKCMDDCSAQHTDQMALLKCAFTKIMEPCPDIEFLKKMMPKSK